MSTDQPGRPNSGRWLAIETSGLFGSVAAGEVCDDGCSIVASAPLPRDQRSARTLAPAIERLLNECGWRPAEVTCVAVAVGPGSFTGLRVGVTTAKAFAYAVGAGAVAVDTLDALAEAAEPQDSGRLWATLDAQRRELFLAPFEAEDAGWTRGGETHRSTRDELAAELAEGDAVVGPLAEELAALRPGVSPIIAEPAATAVLRVAWRRWAAGEWDDPLALVPRYHRLSAAEEKAAASGD